MADIKITGTPEVTAPSVSLAPVTVKPSAIGAFSEAIIPGLQTYAKNLAAARAGAKAAEDERKIADLLDTMTMYSQEEINKIGPDYLPSQAKTNIQIEMRKKLAKSGIPSKQWSTISGQINTLVDDIGTPHFFAMKDVQYAMLPDGTVKTIYKPGTDPKEAQLTAAMAAVGKGTLAEYYRIMEENPEEADAFLTAQAHFVHKADVAGLSTKILNEQSNRLNLSEARKKQLYPENKEKLFKEIIPDLNDFANSNTRFLKNTTANPEQVYRSWEETLKARIYNENEFAKQRAAGFNTPDEFWNSLAGYRTAVKEQFNINSKFGQDELKLAEADTKVKLVLAEAQKSLSPSTLIYLNKGNNLSNIALTASFVKKLSNSDTYPELKELATVLKNSDRNVSVARKDLQLNIENKGTYITYVKDFLSQVDTLEDPKRTMDTILDVDPNYFIKLGHMLIDDPNFKTLKDRKPQYAAMIQNSLKKMEDKYQGK